MASLNTQELLGKVSSSLTMALGDGCLGRALEETLQKKKVDPGAKDLGKVQAPEPETEHEKEITHLLEKLRESLAQALADGSMGKALEEALVSKTNATPDSEEAPTAPPSPSVSAKGPGSEEGSCAADAEEVATALEAFEAASVVVPENPPSDDRPLDTALCATFDDLKSPEVLPQVAPKAAKHRDGWLRRLVRCACGKLSSRPGPEE